MSDNSSEASSLSDTFQPSHINLSSVIASQVAHNPQSLHTWAASVNLDPNPLDGECLPEALKKLVEDSRMAPSWMFNLESPQYKFARRFFELALDGLADQAAKELSECPTPDEELSDELEHALPDILQALETASLDFVPPPNEADLRRPLDQLNVHAWQHEGNYNFLHSLAHPDSCRSVLHWANEFKREANKTTSKHQVWMAMVSGLYQRRALGFKDHYVYGTAHHSTHELTVFAGAWNNAGFEGGGLSKDAKTTLYELDTFEVSSPADMVRYYLLMRLSRLSALEYKESLEAITSRSIRNSLGNDKGLGSWPPDLNPLPPHGHLNLDNRGTKRRRWSLGQEDHSDSATLPDNALSEPNHSTPPGAASNTDRSAHGGGVDDPLK